MVRAYTSPTLVLLAMDWAAGIDHEDFLGFAILRSPGFSKGEADGYLLNKVGFLPPQPNSQSLPSNVSPIQKFLWWDSAISDADRGNKFEYTVTPVLGTGPRDLKLFSAASASTVITVPTVERNKISTWFNRAVVSSQAFSREFPNPQANLDACMRWLANGMGDAFEAIVRDSGELVGAIYHLTDKEWALEAFQARTGSLSLVYEGRKTDPTDNPAIEILKAGKAPLAVHPRTKTAIMHDKFVVDVTNGRVLAGSANFTPEGLTSQANLLHIFASQDLADLYTGRQKLMADDPAVAETARHTGWSKTVEVDFAKVRVFFSPEPDESRVSVDTVVSAIKAARSSVIFCLFDPTDVQLIQALLATSDRGKLLYGLLNSISDPNNKKASQSDSGEAPRQPSAGTQIKVTLFNRSRKDKKVVAYDYFSKNNAPAGFLPEFSSVDFSARSTLPPPAEGGKKKFVPAVHIHHKFIVIDADTPDPTIYTGSANLSNNSTHRNDENLLEITRTPELAQTYFAEFMRLYEHYRARAIWDWTHKVNAKSKAKTEEAFTLKTTRDEWVRGAYKPDTLESLARTTLAKEIAL